MRRTKTQESYHNMVQRCCDPGRWDYSYYGARGITVCDRWLPRPAPDGTGYRNFLADMGERPPGTTLDRIDNDRGYEPGNCRWASRAEQAQNSSAAKLTWHEVRQIRALASVPHSDLASRFGVTRRQINNILRNKCWMDQQPALERTVAK